MLRWTGPLWVSVANLTGRTDVWRFIFRTNTFSSYLFGNGYSLISPAGVFKNEVTGQSLNCAHNAYLTVFLGVGPIGFLMFMLFFVHSGQRVLNVKKYISTEYLSFFCVTLCIFAVNATTDSLFGIQLTPAMCFIFIAFTPPIIYRSQISPMYLPENQALDRNSLSSKQQGDKKRRRPKF